jgi:hypothetical protein
MITFDLPVTTYVRTFLQEINVLHVLLHIALSKKFKCYTAGLDYTYLLESGVSEYYHRTSAYMKDRGKMADGRKCLYALHMAALVNDNPLLMRYISPLYYSVCVDP